MAGGTILSFIVFIIVLGCATQTQNPFSHKIDHLPPTTQISFTNDLLSVDFQLKKHSIKNSGPVNHWWSQYRRAQLWENENKNLSCQLYTQLSMDRSFPLYKLATIRSYEICPSNDPLLAELSPFQASDFEPWFQAEVKAISYNLAKKRNDLNAIYELSLEKSKLPLKQSKKLEFTKVALNAAKKLKNKKKVQAMNHRLEKLAPRYIKKPKLKEYNKIAYDYRRQRDFANAKSFYKSVLNSRKATVAQKVKAFRGIASVYKILLDHKRHIKTLEQLDTYLSRLLRKNKRSKYYQKLVYKNRLKLARAHWTRGHIKITRKILFKTEKQFKNKISLSQLYWILGRMDEEKGRYSSSITWFDKALNEKGLSNYFKEKTLWFKAWNLRKIKKFHDSSEIFQTLIETSKNPHNKYKYQFWLGKTYQDMNKIKLANEEFKKLSNDPSINYYSLLAHREIDKKIARLGQKRSVASINKPKKLREIFDNVYFEWLISVQEYKTARNYLNHIAKKYEELSNRSSESWVTILKLYARTGEYLSLYKQLGHLPKKVRAQVTQNHPELLFPSPYKQVVGNASQKFGISPEFIYSIMKQESGFNIRARSPMDAFGLMQMLPKVAKASARKIRLPYKKEDDLYKPEVSIPLGAFHLRELWERFDGNFILAVASYNASQRAIRNWIATRYKGNTLEFIEDIPYEETKSYIKLVTRNLIHYTVQNSSQTETEFPEWALEFEI